MLVGDIRKLLKITRVYISKRFLLLDEAVASRVIFVIVSGSGGRAEERFWSQLNNSKTVRHRSYALMGS